MREYALIGQPLIHSFSKKYFEDKFLSENLNAHYSLCDLQKDELMLFFSQKKYDGINVTIPYKEEVLKYTIWQDEIVQKTGVANCLKKTDKGYKAYNTDVLGFEFLLQSLKLKHKNALILGTGASSKTVAYVLDKYSLNYKKVSRKKSQEYFDYNDLLENIFDNYTLIINTTPLGTFPEIYNCPLKEFNFFTEKNSFIDLVYNPTKSLLLQKAENQQSEILNGYEMLKIQADASWTIWNDISK